MSRAPDRLSPGSLPPAAGSRRLVLLLALLFLGPLLLSSLLYYVIGWRPAGRTNHGMLIEPPRPLADPLFHGKWSLVYISSGDCAAECQHALYYLRQTHLGLGRLGGDVQRLFLIDRHCCADQAQLERDYPELIQREESNPQGLASLAPFPADGREHSVFIVDPRGNLMMRYDLRTPPKGLLEDLKQLLQLSSNG